MARTKKTVAPAAEVKAAPVEVKKEAATKAVAAPKTEAAPKAEVKPVAKKPAAKKTETKAAAKKPAAKKPAAKKAAAKKAPKPITVEDIAAKLAKKLDAKKAAAIDRKCAVDIKLYGTFEAHMYIEVKDGKLTVAPYDYIEKDIEAAIAVENALAIIDGKLTIADALADGRLYAFGDIAVAAKLAALFA